MSGARASDVKSSLLRRISTYGVGKMRMDNSLIVNDENSIRLGRVDTKEENDEGGRGRTMMDKTNKKSNSRKSSSAERILNTFFSSISCCARLINEEGLYFVGSLTVYNLEKLKKKKEDEKFDSNGSCLRSTFVYESRIWNNENNCEATSLHQS